MIRFRMTREMQIPKGAVKIADKQSDAVAYIYPTSTVAAGKPAAMVFFGKSDKPVFRNWFVNEKQRDAKIALAFENRREWLKRKAAAKAERVAWVPDYKVGEVMHSSYGYEQTNVSYWQIVDVKGKYVWLRELQQERNDTGWMQGTCKPKPGKFAEPRYAGDDRGQTLRRLAQKHGIKIDDVQTAYRGGGEMHWSSYH